MLSALGSVRQWVIYRLPALSTPRLGNVARYVEPTSCTYTKGTHGRAGWVSLASLSVMIVSPDPSTDRPRTEALAAMWGPSHRGTFGTYRQSQVSERLRAEVRTMFTDLDAVRSLNQATAATFWVGLAFTAALLVAMVLIARALGWGGHEQDEETTARGHPGVQQAA